MINRMMNKYTISNFKAFSGPATVPIKPLTLIFGPNSSGKSSILQSLLMLKQTLGEAINPDTALLPKGKLVDLGSYREFIHRHEINRAFSFKVRMFIPERFEEMFPVDDPVGLIEGTNDRARMWLDDTWSELDYEQMDMEITFSCGDGSRDVRPAVSRIALFLGDDPEPVLTYANEGQRTTSRRVMNLKTTNAWHSYWELEGNDYWLFKAEEFESEQAARDLSRMIIAHGFCDDSGGWPSGHAPDMIGPLEDDQGPAACSGNHGADVKNATPSDDIEDSIEKLNQLLSTPNLYDILTTKRNGVEHSEWLKSLLKSTTELRRQRFEDLNEREKRKITRLNRVLMHEAYSHLVPKPKSWHQYTEAEFKEKSEKWTQFIEKNKREHPEEWTKMDEKEKKLLEKLYEDTIEEYRKNGRVPYADNYISLQNYLPIMLNGHDPQSIVYNKWDDTDSCNVSLLLLAASFAFRESLDRIVHIGPQRAYPERFYAFSGAQTDEVGQSGKYVSDILTSNEELLPSVNKQLERVNLDYEIKVVPLSNEVSDVQDLFALRLNEKSTGLPVSLTDVGFGVSQVLPIIVQSMLSEEKMILIEQPELHLHPAQQAELGDVFIESSLERENTLIIETHSEHLILRLLRRIRETTNGELEEGAHPLTPGDIAVIYAKPTPEGTTLIKLRVTEDGDFADKWPDGFFAERAKELF